VADSLGHLVNFKSKTNKVPQSIVSGQGDDLYDPLNIANELTIILVNLVLEWLKKFLLQMVCLSILQPYVHLSICMKRQRKK